MDVYYKVVNTIPPYVVFIECVQCSLAHDQISRRSYCPDFPAKIFSEKRNPRERFERRAVAGRCWPGGRLGGGGGDKPQAAAPCT